MHYDIRVDPNRRLLCVDVRGFWTLDVAEAYFSALLPVLDSIKRYTPAYDVLTDTSEWHVQATDVQLLLEKYFRNPWPGRRAFIVPSVLLRLQAKRLLPNIIGDPRTMLFDDKASATEWLAIDDKRRDVSIS